jgi:hypothetical protein
MLPLYALFRHQVEANRAVVTMNQLLQGRVARRPFRRVADLQNMLGRVFRVHPEFMYGPCFHRTNTRAGRERVLGGFVQEMHGRFDAMATADMDPCTMLQAMNRFMALAVQVVFGFIVEDESFRIDLDADSSERVVKLAERDGLGDFGFEYAGPALDLNKNNNL